MNRRRAPDREDWLCRIYAAALHLYPRGHRERWGTEMRLVFRERCRQLASARQGLCGWLLAVVLPDLIASTFREGVAAFFHVLQGGPMRKSALIALGIVLEVVGTALLIVSVIGLGYSVHSGRFSYPGGFDALTGLQLAFGIGGASLLALGIRELASACRPRLA